VIQSWRNLDSARSRVVSFSAQVRANEVALNGVRQEALVGSRTTLDVLNAEQELVNSQVNLIYGAPRRAGELLTACWPASAG
jgi:outer membrane protein